MGLMSRILRGQRTFAEDVVQEAFTRALKYISLFDPAKGEMGVWFNGILFNALRDLQNEELGHQELYRDICIIDMFPAEEWKTLEKPVANLISNVANDKHKQILHLFFVKGYTSKQVAQIVPETTQTNVTTVVMRFRNFLRGPEKASGGPTV